MDETLEFAHAALRASPDGILVVDDDGRYVWCNQTAARLLGTEPERIAEHRFGDFSRGAMRLSVPEWWSELRRAGKLVIRHVVTDANGTDHPVETRGRAHVQPGRHLLVMRPVEAAKEPQGRTLSPREREVLTLVGAGLTTGEMAAQLVLSPLTVRTHVRNAMEKLAARTRAHATVIALQRGEIHL